MRPWVRLVATGLEAVQPVLDVARAPPYFAPADMTGAWECAAARATIQSGARFESGDAEHVGYGQELIPVRRHGVVLSLVGMQDVANRGVGVNSVPHSRKFMHRQSAEKAIERRVDACVDFLHSAISRSFVAKLFLLLLERLAFELRASKCNDDLDRFPKSLGF